MSELRECPFCGSAYTQGVFSLLRHKTDCYMMTRTIEAWNRRAVSLEPLAKRFDAMADDPKADKRHYENVVAAAYYKKAAEMIREFEKELNK